MASCSKSVARACLLGLCALFANPCGLAAAETNTVIEELTFEVEPNRLTDFLRHDSDIWTAMLASQEGFLGKRVWVSAEDKSRVRLVIEWRSRDDWNAVPQKKLAHADRRFREAMGGDSSYRMIASKAFDAMVIPPSASPGLASYDLVARASEWAAETEKVEIPRDGVFHRTKVYRAVPLDQVLRGAFDLEAVDTTSTRIAFECLDGYKATMLLSEALAADGWVAVADTEAKPGRLWVDAVEAGHRVSLAPYYVVWKSRTGTPGKLPWPYAVVRLRLVEDAAFYQAAYPHDAPEAVAGFDGFRKHCATCHAVNGVGGLLGGELNSPVSVTTYWNADHLRAFILNPSSYRADCRMPSMKHVPEAELDAILTYLTEMAGGNAAAEAASISESRRAEPEKK
ncbi:MAG: TIGR03792 family protein [Planctomycetota bacterium]